MSAQQLIELLEDCDSDAEVSWAPSHVMDVARLV
jgi:hypothetical protein